MFTWTFCSCISIGSFSTEWYLCGAYSTAHQKVTWTSSLWPFQFSLRSLFSWFQKDNPDQPWASLAAKRHHSLPDAGIQTHNMNSLMLTNNTTNKDWIIQFLSAWSVLVRIRQRANRTDNRSLFPSGSSQRSIPHMPLLWQMVRSCSLQAQAGWSQRLLLLLWKKLGGSSMTSYTTMVV